MSFHNETNAKRVNKIVDTLQLIQKSGASNGIDREDMWNMLERAINQIGDMIGEDPQKPEPVPETPVAPKQRAWVDVRAMAEEASLSDLTYAMAVYLNRIDEHLKG